MNSGHPRAFPHQLLVARIGKEADVVGDRSRQKLVVLHHGGDLVAIGADAERPQRNSIDEYLAARRLQQAEHDLHQRGLAAARRPHDGGCLARTNGEVDILQDEILGSE